MRIAISSSDSRYDALFLNNFATINLVDKIGSLPGVGDCRLAASQNYGMRLWVNPDKMAELGVTATDINTAVQAQNRQNPAGSIAQPPVDRGNDFQYPVNAKGRLETPEQFENIVVRAQPDGSLLRIRDLGHVTLGAQDYASFSRFNGRPSAVIIVYPFARGECRRNRRPRAGFHETGKPELSRRHTVTTSITTRRGSCALRFAKW